MGGEEQLESRIATFEPGVKLFCAIAAKVSTLHALAGRYTQHLTLDDLTPSASPASTPSSDAPPAPSSAPSARDLASAQRELDADQARLRALMRETAADATRWLAVVCAHFGVDMAQLPEQPDSGMRMPDALDPPLPKGEGKEGDEEERRKEREKREWDVVWELVLVSLGLIGAGQQAGEQEKEKKASGVGAAAAAKVGGLFSSSSASKAAADKASAGGGTAAAADKAAPPPLNYTALSRSLVVSTAEVLGIGAQVVADVERTIAQFLYFQLQHSDEAKRAAEQGAGGAVEWDEAAKEYREKAAKKGNALKWAATGAGFVLGGVAIGLTGGLAAPAIAAGLGTIGIAGFSGAGGAVLIGTLLGLGGGGLAGYRTHRRMKGLEDVRFEPIKDDELKEAPQIPSLTATIVASGFLVDEKDSVDPWRPFVLQSKVDAYSLKADPQTFLEAGQSLDQFVKNKLISMGGAEIVKRTALAAVYAGVALPLTMYKSATTAFDSDFTRCREKARTAGVLLAEILEKEVQGKRPVVLIGYGPGASLILSTLQHLHALDLPNLVYSAVLISLPDAPSPVAWAKARSVVAHEIVNAWSGNDWVLGIAARLYTLNTRIAGLRPVHVSGITDVNISDLVGAHMDLRAALPAILDRVAYRREEQPVEGAVPPVRGVMEGGGEEVGGGEVGQEMERLRLGEEEGEGEEERKEEARELGREVERRAAEAEARGEAARS